MRKQTVICAALIELAIANVAFAQQAPPTSERTMQIEAMVDKAAALLDSEGKAALPAFRVKDSEWYHGDSYLFVYDLNSNVLPKPVQTQSSQKWTYVKAVKMDGVQGLVASGFYP